MHPNELKNKYHLTYTQLATALGKSELHCKSWGLSPTYPPNRLPPLAVRLQCLALDRLWEKEGVSLPALVTQVPKAVPTVTGRFDEAAF